jgi:hypothetical protein
MEAESLLSYERFCASSDIEHEGKLPAFRSELSEADITSLLTLCKCS